MQKQQKIRKKKTAKENNFGITQYFYRYVHFLITGEIMNPINIWKYLPIGSFYNWTRTSKFNDYGSSPRVVVVGLFHGIYAMAGMGLLLIYANNSITTGELNPLTQQSTIQDVASAHSLLEEKVFALADKDGNSVLSLAEAGELYQRVGIGVEIPKDVFTRYPLYLPKLSEENLETALRSYQAEK